MKSDDKRLATKDQVMNETKSIPVIQAIDLTVGYGETVVLENINFSIEKGEIFVIIGVCLSNDWRLASLGF